MKGFVEYLFLKALWLFIRLRYRVKIVGLEEVEKELSKRSSGILFLSNHPTVFIDPLIAGLSVFSSFRIRPMIIDYMYNAPYIRPVARFLNALAIPNFYISSNSLKKRQGERVIEEIVEGLKNGQNFMIAPAGRVKKSNLELIGGASSAHRIIQSSPHLNVVLIRTKGLYGSAFSTYNTGSSPLIGETLSWGFKQLLKNLLFFTPKRDITVEVELAPQDFPFSGTRIELNRYLENWYNRPDGLTAGSHQLPGDSVVLVSYSMWGEKFLPLKRLAVEEKGDVDVGLVPKKTVEMVVSKIAELTGRPLEAITPEMSLAIDLGMDSLDLAEMTAFLQDHFDILHIPVNELTSVAKVLGLAAHTITYKEEAEEGLKANALWKREVPQKLVSVADGETIPEVFLKNCERMKGLIACADDTSGVVTYSQLKIRVILLAEYIRQLPGSYVGVLLPASVAASAVMLAVQLAGKIPVPVNWTVGPRHLEAMLQLVDIKVVLTSMAFLDRLENVDLGPVEPFLIMLEDVRTKFTLMDKLRAFCRSKLKSRAILRIFHADQLQKESPGVLLFTSGTESLPKGVPLSYGNLLANLRSAVSAARLYSNDVLFGILPPFHSFGFTISGLCAFTCGIKVAYFPNPTDGKKMADRFEEWGITVLVGAPIFLKGILNAAKPGQLKTLRICITGAEKAPAELFRSIENVGGALLEGYGITECSPVLTLNPLAGKKKGVGLALPGVDLAIVHPETNEPLPANTQGMILAKGESIFSGYLNRDVASPFVQYRGSSWYKTGDLGALDEDGYLTISGRLKRFIKVGGEMISLLSLEDALHKASISKGWLEGCDDGPTLAICAKEEAGEKPKIFLFSKFDISAEEANASLKEFGFSNLARISLVTRLSEIPVMGTGKINYRALEAYEKKVAN